MADKKTLTGVRMRPVELVGSRNVLQKSEVYAIISWQNYPAAPEPFKKGMTPRPYNWSAIRNEEGGFVLFESAVTP